MTRSMTNPSRLCLALLLTVLAVKCAVAQPLTNGGFEDAQDFNSWTIEEAFSGSLLVCDSSGATAHSGVRSAHFGAHEGVPDVLSKRLATIPGLTYRITFWLASDNIAPVYDGFVVTWGTQVLLDLTNPQTGFPYTRYSFDVPAAGMSEELAFHGYKRFGSFRLDDVNVLAAPPSDACSGAPQILPNATYYGDNLAASNDGSATCGLPGTADVWYQFFAPCNTTLTLDTCGSDFDTTLAVFSGSCGSLTQLGCNDDNGGAGDCNGGTTSHLSVAVTAGTFYYIRVAGYGASSLGNFELAVRMQSPENDPCAGATPISLNDPVSGDNSCATTDGMSSCGNTGSRDVWFSYTPDCTHLLRLDTCGSSFDTVVSIYSGGCGFLTEVACNDDRPGGEGACGGLTSRLDFLAVSGTPYLIRLARFGSTGAGGDFTLSAQNLDPTHDTCAAAQPIQDGPTQFDATCAAAPSGLFCNEAPDNRPGRWFSYTAGCTGAVSVSICDPEGAPNARVSAFAGDCGNLTCVGSADLTDLTRCPEETEAFAFDAAGGQTYFICYTQAAGEPLRAGTITLRNARPENDACANATPISDGVHTGNTSCTDTDGGTVCRPVTSHDVWYQWTAACDGTLTLDTCGSDFDTVLSVYRGACGAFEELSCNDDESSFCPGFTLASRVSLAVTAGEIYTVRVAGYNANSGNYQLNVASSAAFGVTCAEAAPIPVGTTEFDGACAAGTGGRFCDFAIDGPGVWFTYTAACDGPKTLEFCRTGGPPRALFSVFSGDCDSLVCVASRNLTSIPQFCPSGASVLSFDASAGTIYYICYTQFAGTPLGAGELTIVETPPAADSCFTAAPLVLGVNPGNTGCATPDGTAQCYPDAADVWFHYTPAADGRLTLDTCGSSFDTILSIFSGTCGNLSLFGCSDDAEAGFDCAETTVSHVVLDVVAGTPYRIRVGGQNGETGAFMLNATLRSSNDDCADAELVSAGMTLTGDLALAAADGSASCSAGTDRDVWYRWIPSNCSTELILDTCGSSVDAVLSVFTGGCESLIEIACNNGAGTDGLCPNQPGASYLALPVTPGEQYWIRVAGAGGAADTFVLHVNEAPRNAACVDARLVGSGETRFDGRCGLIDPAGTPASCGRPNQATMWFLYRAECNGVVAVDLCGSTYDTAVSVYSGVCGSLTELACNDNAGGSQCPENPFNSYVEFTAAAGQTYVIRVSSTDSELGDGRMTLDCQPSCPEDLNQDGEISLTDLAILLAHFGTDGGAEHRDGDITGDGVIDLSDLSLMLAAFGTLCD